jgi:menaquinone-dependent protoporphyrinogen IX oxidase
MTKIHCLFPSNVGHMYIAKRGDLPHYQEVFSKFVRALKRYDNRMPVYVYMRGEDYSNHFMLLQNSAKVVQPFVDRVDWMDLYCSLFCPKKKAEKAAGIVKQ